MSDHLNGTSVANQNSLHFVCRCKAPSTNTTPFDSHLASDQSDGNDLYPLKTLPGLVHVLVHGESDAAGQDPSLRLSGHTNVSTGSNSRPLRSG